MSRFSLAIQTSSFLQRTYAHPTAVSKVATPANDNDVELIISFSVFVLCSHYLFAFNVDLEKFSALSADFSVVGLSCTHVTR